MAKAYTGRNEFIALTHSFHGRTVGTLSVTGNMQRKKRGGPYLPGVAFAPAPYLYRNPFGTDDPEILAQRCAEMVEWAIKYQTSGNVAAFIAEPVMGDGGIIVPPANYFRYVKEILDRYGILFIADEVQSGFGRTGKLFAIAGVEGVFFGYDFVTITKSDALDWQHLKPAVLGTIMEHFMAGQPVMAAANSGGNAMDDGEFFDDEDETIVATIKELLETRVRPAVAQDGGDITFSGFKEGTVFLNMKGACAGCPSSTATLKHGIQNLLKHFIPEVREVEAV